MVAYSAQGTRLNRRGLESRRHILDVAIRCLAEGGPEAANVNLIARKAGVTWGTVQHHFGDTDGVWAALLEHAHQGSRETFPRRAAVSASLRPRVAAVVNAIWAAYEQPTVQAVMNLRLALPRDHNALAEAFPATSETLKAWDEGWSARWDTLFRDLVTSSTKLRRLQSLLPAALHGLYLTGQMPTFTDVEEGRKALIDAITCYLR